MMSLVTGLVMTLSISGASSPGRSLKLLTNSCDKRTMTPLANSSGSRTSTDSQLKQSWTVAPANALQWVTVIICYQRSAISVINYSQWLLVNLFLRSSTCVWWNGYFSLDSVCEYYQKFNKLYLFYQTQIKPRAICWVTYIFMPKEYGREINVSWCRQC